MNSFARAIECASCDYASERSPRKRELWRPAASQLNSPPPLSSRPSFLSLSPPLVLLVGRKGLGERKLGRRLNTEAASPRFETGTRARQKLLFNQLLYTQTTALEALIYITELKSLTCSCDAFVSVIKYCMSKSRRSRIPKSCYQFQGV